MTILQHSTIDDPCPVCGALWRCPKCHRKLVHYIGVTNERFCAKCGLVEVNAGREAD